MGGNPLISTAATDIVRLTLPVIASKIEAITPIFYQRMFAAHPELERDLFNRGNQAQGDQQRALAGAIAAYASLLVDDEARGVDAVLARVANKHASLGITEDQYPIVYRYLFEAISEVLGEDASPEILHAWSEVYWDMAHSLIDLEDRLYAGSQVAPGEVWRDLVVRERVQQSPDTVAYGLAHPDGMALPTAAPGQYVSVQVTLADGARQIRQYSLTRAPRQQQWGITVKAVPAATVDGVDVPVGQVSNFLHQNVFEGDHLRCSLPYGDLVLEDRPDPLLLVSAGIGCTPIIGMLHYLARTGPERDITVLHADQSPARHAHRRELSDLVDQIPSAHLIHWYEDLGLRSTTGTVRHGLINLDDIHIDPSVRAYLCGPPAFMDVVRQHLLDHQVPAAHINYEVFGPDTWTPSIPAA